MTGTLHEDRHAVVIVSRSVLRMKNVSSNSFRENRNKHFMFSTWFFFFFENAAVSEIMWKNAAIATQKTTDDNTAHADCMLDY